MIRVRSPRRPTFNPLANRQGLVSLHRGVLVFLQVPPPTVQRPVYCSVYLSDLIFEGGVPPDENQGGDYHKFSQ
jgi:hypothetical protein